MVAAKAELNKSENIQKYLTFIVDKDVYGLRIDYIKQIIGVQEIAVLPNQPDYIKGVINLRGNIIPIMDMRLKFDKKEKEYDDRTCFIILEISEDEIGIVVDSVSEVIDIEKYQISVTPNFDQGIDNKYIKGVVRLKEQLVIMIDCLELLKFVDVSMVENVES